MRTNASAPFLVAEDNPHDMFQFTRLLNSSGATNSVHIALTGAEAIELLERVTARNALVACPAAAFLDVDLRQGDGFDVLAWIRTYPALDAMPIIMLADTDNPAEVARSAQLGAQCHFLKYPSRAGFGQLMEELARFHSGHRFPIFDLPANLLRR